MSPLIRRSRMPGHLARRSTDYRAVAAQLHGQLGQSFTLKNVLGQIASRNGKVIFPCWLGATQTPIGLSHPPRRPKVLKPNSRASFFGIMGSGVATGKRFELWRPSSRFSSKDPVQATRRRFAVFAPEIVSATTFRIFRLVLSKSSSITPGTRITALGRLLAPSNRANLTASARLRRHARIGRVDPRRPSDHGCLGPIGASPMRRANSMIWLFS